MRGNGAPFALFDEQSASVFSPAFYVAPGKAALFQAFGFETVSREVEPGRAWARPQVCLRQILYQAPDVLPDLWLVDQVLGVYREGLKGLVMAEGQVITHGCAWTLSACDTIALLDIPGSYRLELNDPGSVGQARVYMRALAPEAVPRRSARLYWGEE